MYHGFNSLCVRRKGGDGERERGRRKGRREKDERKREEESTIFLSEGVGGDSDFSKDTKSLW